DVDATELLATKRTLEERTGEKYSLLSLVARFVIAGLKKFPILNSSIDTAAGEIVTHGDINLGLAAQTPRGLMVPVLHGAGRSRPWAGPTPAGSIRQSWREARSR